MGVRVEAGGGWRGAGCLARACGGAAPVSRESGQCRAARRRAPSPSAPCALPHAPKHYNATRVPRSLVLWCFMMVRHETARYADVP